MDSFDFYSSDQHFDHINMTDAGKNYSGRPYANVDEMNEALVERWNDVVSPTDRVLVLGDVCMGKVQESLVHVGRLRGRKFLLPGNHDRCWQGKKKYQSWVRRYVDAGFESVFTVDVMDIMLGEARVLAAHFPYRGDHSAEQRYLEHRPVDRGAVLLHGHVHELWKRDGRQINVGVDVWNYRPVSADELVALL